MMLTILHMVITLFILSPMFYPIKWLRKGAFIMPFIWTVYWLIFDGCHLTKYTHKDEDDPSYILKMINGVGININRSQSDKFIQCVMVLIPTVICYRLINNK